MQEKKRSSGLLLGGLLVLQGCSSMPSVKEDVPQERWERSNSTKRLGKIFEEDIVLFGKKKSPHVSKELWSSALDVLSPFSLSLVNYSSGLIQTEWGTLKDCPKDRFQIRVIIYPSLGINVGAVSVSVMRSSFENNGWKPVQKCDLLAARIKYKILQRARSYLGAQKDVLLKEKEL